MVIQYIGYANQHALYLSVAMHAGTIIKLIVT